jgi:hypothetical protein
MNLGGASDRPVLDDVWKKVEKQLQGVDAGDSEQYTTIGVFHLLAQKMVGSK